MIGKHWFEWARWGRNAGVRRGWRRPAIVMAVAAASLFVDAGVVLAALREPPLLNRDQVRAGLSGRLEQMQSRQRRHLERRDRGGRYRMSPGGRPEIRVPRDPMPAPPPAALPGLP